MKQKRKTPRQNTQVRSARAESSICPAPSSPLTHLGAAKFAEKLTPVIQRILEKGYERLEKEIGELPPTSLPMTLGILQDKYRQLNDMVAPQSKNVLVVSGLSRAQAFELLGVREAVSTPQLQPIDIKAEKCQ